MGGINRDEVEMSAPRSVEEVVTEALRNAILQGILAPGERLAQSQLADQLGVSRIPLRDALRRLEVEGLVRLDGRRGAWVTSLDERDITEIYELRLMFEPVCMELAVTGLDDTSAELLCALSERMDEEDLSSAEALMARRLFYGELYSRAGRRYTSDLIVRLRNNVDRYHALERRDHSHAAHADIRDCIRSRDGEKAARILSAHLKEARDDLTTKMADASSGKGETEN